MQTSKHANKPASQQAENKQTVKGRVCVCVRVGGWVGGRLVKRRHELTQQRTGWGATGHQLQKKKKLTVCVTLWHSARPTSARMHSLLIPISSSFLFPPPPPPPAPPSIPMANATRESTRRPSLAAEEEEEEEVLPMDVDPCEEGGSEARRAARSLGVVERFATTTAACLRAGLCRVSTRRRAEADVRSLAAFDAPSRDSCPRSWSVCLLVVVWFGGGGI